MKLAALLLSFLALPVLAAGPTKAPSLLVSTNDATPAGSVAPGDAQFDGGVIIGGERRTTWPTGGGSGSLTNVGAGLTGDGGNTPLAVDTNTIATKAYVDGLPAPAIAAVLGSGGNASGLSLLGLTQLQAQQLLDDSGPVALRLDTRTAYQSDGTTPAFSWSNGLQIAGSPVLTAPATNGLLLSSLAAATYQPIGSYAPSTVTNVNLGPYLLSATAASTYQPIGSYAAPSITNGLLTIAAAGSAYAPSTVTNVSLAPYLLSATAAATYQPLGSYAPSTVTNVDLSPYLLSATQAATNNAVQTQLGGKLATNGTISASQISGGTLPMGTLTTVGTNIAGAFLSTDGAGSRSYTRDGSTLTNLVRKLLLLLPAGSASQPGSTNDALKVTITGSNSSWKELQFNDTFSQRARWDIPAAQTAIWGGNSINWSFGWYTTSVVGSVVWRLSMVGNASNAVADVAYQNQTIFSNIVSSVSSGMIYSTVSLTPSNCPAGTKWRVQMERLPADNNDTAVGDARLTDGGGREQ